MKKRIAVHITIFVVVVVAVLVLSGCSTRYNAKPTSEQTPTSVPECFLVTRHDDGVEDQLGDGPIGIYCLESDQNDSNRQETTDTGTTTTTGS